MSSTDPPALNEHHSRSSDERSRTTAMGVISRQPPVSPGSSNGARMMRSSPSCVRRGPLLAVCGLCGGAGASTLAY